MTEQKIPRHIGFILDGNRRWAKQNGLPTFEGHRQGYESLKDIAEAAFDRGVEFVSAYIFSTENWNRSTEEVSYLMKLALKMFKRDIKELHKKGIRAVWLGIEDRLSDEHKKAIKEAVELTKNNKKGTLAICFNYGGRQEIVDAVNNLISQNMVVNEKNISENLYASVVPDIDIMVRTSGEMRISNFMLWRLSYAELVFIDKYWPEFNKRDLDDVIAEYGTRQRRFGA